MKYKILVLGNGLEANWNREMINFNDNFVNWIESLNDEDIEDLIQKIDQKLKKSLSDKEKIKFGLYDLQTEIKRFISEMQKDLKEGNTLKHGDLIETYFSDLGKKIKNLNFSAMNDLALNRFFLSIKVVFGFFIDERTFDVNKKFFTENIEKVDMGLDNIPSLILTTNYTESGSIISDFFKKGIAELFPVKVIPLHGKFLDKERRYSDIEINLEEKDISKKIVEIIEFIHLNEEKSGEKVSEIIIDFFGISLYKDLHILWNLLGIVNEFKIKATITFLFNEVYEEDRLVSEIKSFLEKGLSYRFIYSSSGYSKSLDLVFIEEGELKYFGVGYYGNRGKIKFNIENKSNYFLYKKLKDLKGFIDYDETIKEDEEKEIQS